LSTQPSVHLNFEPADALTRASEEPSAVANALREQAAARLAAHRARRGAPRQAATSIQPKVATGKSASVAAAVAARYAKAQSYRDFLAAEAEEALRRAEAAAEIATRNAEAIAAAQKDLLAELEQQNMLSEIAQWNGTPVAVDEDVSTAGTSPSMSMLELAQEPLSASHGGFADALDVVITEVQAEPYALPEPAMQPAVADSFLFEAEEPVTPMPLPANLIEFPRVLVASRKVRPRLAEGPLRDEADDAAQLRIFEVDAEALSPQPAEPSALPDWSSIRLDAPVRPDTAENPQTPHPAYTIPIQPAVLRPRVAAFAADTALAAAATAAFAGVFAAMARHTGLMPEKKAAAVAVVAVFLLLKLIYQVLFFTLNEATPGMRMARIALCTFGDDNPTRKAMRRRIGATVLAACPMGLGLVWGWFDDDRLGWHDRMTRTYQRSY